MGLMIFAPSIEASIPMLKSILPIVIKRFRRLSLPLPQEYCRLAIMNPNDAVRLLMEFGDSFVRLWGWVSDFLRVIMVFEPSAVIHCYENIDRLKRTMNISIDIARLIIKYRLSDKINYDEWLRLSRNLVRVSSSVLHQQSVIVFDNYVQFIENLPNSADIILLGPLIPTPIDLLALISSGKLGNDYLPRTVDYIIKYIGDYIVTSRDLTEAFLRLINDNEYINFVKSTGLPMILS
ncbi:MAG: hypothetical protein ACP5L5_05475 [Vulcanisaeta sp.]|uniref:hypothetical protein n=1 Tax=Vulcanisaeta sp. TaxID=2020871 RepID=UPI003D0B2D7A